METIFYIKNAVHKKCSLGINNKDYNFEIVPNIIHSRGIEQVPQKKV